MALEIALAPLDERPVNAALPGMVAAVAGAATRVPPRELLPTMRAAGDVAGLASWVQTASGSADALVVSLDLLGYGGLIPARISADPSAAVVSRLAVLEAIRGARPDLPIGAVTTVLRASDGYEAAEEPEYWSEHGAELHRLGAELHRAWLGEASDLDAARAAVPPTIRNDFLARRLRNHVVNLEALALAARGVLDPLLITADDTAVRSAGSLEQAWLDHWQQALAADATVLSYPGADEVGAVLVARMLSVWAGCSPRILVRVPEPGGAGRVAPFENVAIATTVARQVRAAGALVTEDPDDADAALVVHAPDPLGSDWCAARAPRGDAGATRLVAQELASLVARGLPTGLADVRHANGGDPTLVEALRDGPLEGLAAYAGWNTAGNSVGSVVAALIARVAGERRGTFDATAQQRLLLHRLLEDVAYQAVVRPTLTEQREYAASPSRPLDPRIAARFLGSCTALLERELASLPGSDGWRLGNVRLPWQRSFEIDFGLERTS